MDNNMLISENLIETEKGFFRDKHGYEWDKFGNPRQLFIPLHILNDDNEVNIYDDGLVFLNYEEWLTKYNIYGELRSK